MIKDQLNRIEVKEYAEAITYVCTALASVVGVWATVKLARNVWKEIKEGEADDQSSSEG